MANSPRKAGMVDKRSKGMPLRVHKPKEGKSKVELRPWEDPDYIPETVPVVDHDIPESDNHN